MPSIRELTRRDGPRRRPRTAFVLSGGGNLGAIQVGMLRALAERDIVPDVVLGCSVGALNGAGYAAHPTLDGVARLEQHWRETTSHTLMPSSRIPSAVQLLRKGASLHSNEGLRSGLRALLGEDSRIEDLELPFQCVAADVEDAVERWFDQGDLVESILASAALPAVYPPVVIDGRRYIDGGVIDNVPIARAVELGCRTIYVLHVGPHGRPDVEIKRPLDNRRNVVITRNKEFRPHGVTVVPSLKEALALGATEDEVFVIGGGEIFKAALPLASRIYLTVVHAQVEGDTYFPPFEEEAWVLSSEEFHPADERHEYSFTFRRYDRLTD